MRMQQVRTVKLNYVTGVSDSKGKIMMMTEKYHDSSSIDRAFELAWTKARLEMRYLNLKKERLRFQAYDVSDIVSERLERAGEFH